jgi:hypothetical protein
MVFGFMDIYKAMPRSLCCLFAAVETGRRVHARGGMSPQVVRLFHLDVPGVCTTMRANLHEAIHRASSA